MDKQTQEQRKPRKRVKLEERNGVVGKACTKCGKWLSLDLYTVSKKGLGNRTARCKLCELEYRIENNEKISKKQKEWRDKNDEELKIKKSSYYQEKRKDEDWLARQRKKNAERMRNRKVKNTEYAREWRKCNKETYLATVHRRLARKRGLPDNLTRREMFETVSEFSGCVFTESTENIQWDHVIPLSTGHGGTIYGNMIPLRSDLNQSKNDSNIFEWFEANRQRFELSQERFDKLIAWLASANAMTVEEYQDYVYWCHANPRSIDELEAN